MSATTDKTEMRTRKRRRRRKMGKRRRKKRRRKRKKSRHWERVSWKTAMMAERRPRPAEKEACPSSRSKEGSNRCFAEEEAAERK